MRYTVARSNRSPDGTTKVRVLPQSEITYISWRVEGGTGDMAVGWRSLAAGNKIIDPMHIANENNRVVLGYMLSSGDKLEIT